MMPFCTHSKINSSYCCHVFPTNSAASLDTLQYSCLAEPLCESINLQAYAHLTKGPKIRLIWTKLWFCVWILLWQYVYSGKKCNILHKCPMLMRQRLSVTDWHSLLIFYGLGVKWAKESIGKKVVNHTDFSSWSLITTRSSQWPASLHKQLRSSTASCWKPAKYRAGDKTTH